MNTITDSQICGKTYTSRWKTEIGWIDTEFQDDALVALHIHSPEGTTFVEEEPVECLPVIPVAIRTRNWIDAYIHGHNPSPNQICIRLSGTPFQKRVWAELLTIPYGTSITYGELAKRIALEMGIPRMSAQAIGGAVGKNPISILVPCHRVLGVNGKLTGYGGGLPLKRKLLDIEGIPFSNN